MRTVGIGMVVGAVGCVLIVIEQHMVIGVLLFLAAAVLINFGDRTEQPRDETKNPPV